MENEEPKKAAPTIEQAEETSEQEAQANESPQKEPQQEKNTPEQATDPATKIETPRVPDADSDAMPKQGDK